MKTVRNLTLLVAICVVLVALGPARAPYTAESAPLAQTGPTPLWDSGWVETTEGYQTFEHDLFELPTLWTLQVSDDDPPGYYPTEAITWNKVDSTTKYGYLVSLVHCEEIRLVWQEDGIGYSEMLEKWYQRGEAYARLLIFAADDNYTPPCRP